MPFLYSQIDGGFWEQQGDGSWKRIAVCYSGNGPGLNNPNFQGVRNVGPVPVGHYRIVPIEDHSKGPVVFSLAADPGNSMWGRSGFLIHWDNRLADYSASEGCIVNDGHHNIIGASPSVDFFSYLKAKVVSGNGLLEVAAQPPLPSPPKPTIPT